MNIRTFSYHKRFSRKNEAGFAIIQLLGITLPLVFISIVGLSIVRQQDEYSTYMKQNNLIQTSTLVVEQLLSSQVNCTVSFVGQALGPGITSIAELTSVSGARLVTSTPSDNVYLNNQLRNGAEVTEISITENPTAPTEKAFLKLVFQRKSTGIASSVAVRILDMNVSTGGGLITACTAGTSAVGVEVARLFGTTIVGNRIRNPVFLSMGGAFAFTSNGNLNIGGDVFVNGGGSFDVVSNLAVVNSIPLIGNPNPANAAVTGTTNLGGNLQVNSLFNVTNTLSSNGNFNVVDQICNTLAGPFCVNFGLTQCLPAGLDGGPYPKSIDQEGNLVCSGIIGSN